MLLTASMANAQSTTPPIPRERPDNLGQSSQSAEQAIDLEANASTDAQTVLQELAEPNAGLGELRPAISAQQPVTLVAHIAEGGPAIPSGITWRVFGTRANEQGQLEVVARSDDSSAVLGLVPGEYLVHVAYGNAQVSDTLNVTEGPNEKIVVMDAGALKLKSAITGDIDINPNSVRYDIYTSSAEGERVAVVRNARADQVIQLNAGVYNVESNWGSINATVRADLRVEPGQLTEATLFHKASRTNLKLVSEPGGEAIADVEWSIRDDQGTEIFSFIGAFPSLVLAQGEYSVIAKLGANVFNREFDIRAGEPTEVEVLTTVY